MSRTFTLHLLVAGMILGGAVIAARAGAGGFDVGGAVLTDLGNALTSGVVGVAVTVQGTGGTFMATTSATPIPGFWVIHNVPAGTYTVTPVRAGWCFQHVVMGVPGAGPPIVISVDADHQAEIGSIVFLATADCSCTDCADSNSCTIDSCMPGQGCAHAAAAGQPCDDGDGCTNPDACNANAVCAGTPILGCCASAAECDDTLACNGVESCKGLEGCQPGQPVECPAGPPCTITSCVDTAGGCVVVTADSFCDDGLPCTGAETCDPSLGCQPGTPIQDCCVADADCDNGNACDGQETCADGACTLGTPIACDDGDICNGIETCDLAAGCAPGNPLSCDNGIFCDGAEVCDPVDGCQPGSKVDCSDDVACTVDACDEQVQGCTHVPDDSACDDGLFCNGQERCDVLEGCQPVASIPGCCEDHPGCDDATVCSGQEACVDHACVSGIPLECDDGNACTGVETCDPVGGCLPGTPLNCDNGQSCDGVETCHPVNGCQPGMAVDCDDGIDCTVDSCDEAADQCANTPDNNACDDGLVCNGAEICVPLVGCQDGMSISGCCKQDSECDNNDLCDGVEVCADYTCVPGAALICDDDDECNGQETCDPLAGCLPGAPPNCDDGDPCTDDTCDPARRCVHTPVQCGDNETCVDGKCIPNTVSATLIIRRDTCPALLSGQGGGFVAMTLAGEAMIDVTEVVLDSLTLERADGVGGPVRPNNGPPGPALQFKDAVHSFDGDQPCECEAPETADGQLDLVMRFPKHRMISAFEIAGESPGAVIVLNLTGTMIDGTPFAAQDCVVIVPPMGSSASPRLHPGANLLNR